MTRNLSRLVGLCGAFGLSLLAILPQTVRALDTPNTLMGIDGMVLRAGGIFRDPGSFGEVNGTDGFNTFQFGSFAVNNAVTTGKGKYDAFRFQKTAAGDCCISHNARMNSNTPESVVDGSTNPPTTSIIGGSITADYMSVIDRAAYGQVFDPDQYQIQVKFKPLLTQATATSLGTNPFPTNPTYPPISAALENTATNFTVGLDVLGGYVWDAELGGYKRANEGVGYSIGSAENPINNWYVTAPKDAEGYATWSVPVTSPSFSGRGFYYSFGSGDFRAQEVLSNGGKVFNEETQVWDDVNNGFGPNYQQFGGGPSEPGNPSSKLDAPNGVTVMSLGAPAATLGLSLEIKSIALTRINPSPIMARIDANSGIAFRFGSGFTYGASQPPINTPIGALNPLATEQISRFDENGMTNLKIDMRTPDDPNEVHRFLVRGAPNDATFDATNAMVNVRARLLEPLAAGIAENLTIIAKARKGNDDVAGKGADQWDYNLDLNQFNTTTMTTVSIPLSTFTRNTTATTLGPPPGFANMGDGLLTNFGLYEFGGLVPANTGLLKLELEYMEIRLPSQGLIGDYNDSGTVDAADYTIWRNNVGQPGSTLLNRDPANGSGNVGQNDFASWKSHFGESNLGSGSLAGANVPEPTTMSLFAMAMTAIALRRRGR